MGRWSTGVWTVNESTRLELPWLIKKGFIKKNCIVQGNLKWTNKQGRETASIGFRSSYFSTGNNNYAELTYIVTKDGEKTKYNYKIYFAEVPSNLGKGSVLYFICPETLKKCRILYLAYGSPTFKSRKAYRHRLYYGCQLSSKLSKYNDTYWRIEDYLKDIKAVSCRGQRKYKLQPTRAAKRYKRLSEKQRQMDELRWTIGAPKCVRESMKEFGLM